MTAQSRRILAIGLLLLMALTGCDAAENAGDRVSSTLDRSTTTTNGSTTTADRSTTTADRSTTTSDRSTTTSDRSTTTEPATTTTEKQSTTTERTTAVEPATTSTTARQTTTTSGATATTAATTTTTAVSTDLTSSESDNTAAWILLALIGFGAIGGLIAYFNRRNRRAASASQWLQQTAPLVESAQLARDLLVDGAADPYQREQISNRVATVAAEADRASAYAPDDVATQAAAGLAAALRNLEFADEAQQLLKEARTPPTAEQLASADATRRTRVIELDSSLQRLGSEIDLRQHEASR